MHTFKTLNELLAYIPNCLICQKIMSISIDGTLSSVNTHKPRWSSGQERLSLKLTLKDGILCSKHKNHSLSIEAETNIVIDGLDMTKRFMPGTLYVRKMCPTCHFKINTVSQEGIIKKENGFPPLTIHSEELHYTMKGGKDVRITKYYQSHASLTGEAATIRLDNKFLPPVPLDFDKMRDLAHLNKRLATIKLFH